MPRITPAILPLLAALSLACTAVDPPGDAGSPEFTPWISLFDGETLGAWTPIDWGGQGPCEVTGGELRIGIGESVSGVRYRGDLAEILPPTRENYELRLEARRVSGYDFFCGLTFPVGLEGHLSLICGGWSGGVLGLSCLDGWDASENDTTRSHWFDTGRWYAVMVRVTTDRIECFIDGECLIYVDRNRYEEFSVRPEMLEYEPLGLSTFQTEGAFRKIEIRARTSE
jgi:hypothetical protein